MKAQWGAIGVGAFSANVILPAMQRTVHIEAIASRDISRAAALAKDLGIPRTYDSYDGLLADESLTHVYIGVPTSEHIEWSEKALLAGKTVLCEKPFSTDPVAASLFWHRISTANLSSKLHVGWMYRHHPRWHRIRRLAARGELGALTGLEFYYSYVDSGDNPRRRDADYEGGSLALVGCYGAHIAQELVQGTLGRVTAVRHGPVGEADVGCAAAFAIDHTLVTLISDFRSPFAQFLRIHGDRGWLDVPMPINPSPTDPTELRGVVSGNEFIERFEPADQFALQAAVIEEGSPFRQSLRSDIVFHAELLSQILRSAATGG